MNNKNTSYSVDKTRLDYEIIFFTFIFIIDFYRYKSLFVLCTPCKKVGCSHVRKNLFDYVSIIVGMLRAHWPICNISLDFLEVDEELQDKRKGFISQSITEGYKNNNFSLIRNFKSITFSAFILRAFTFSKGP